MNIEFQPSGFEQGTYLNVGAQWLWRPSSTFVFEYGDPIRVQFSAKNSKGFVTFESKEQFAAAARDIARAAAKEMVKLREIFGTLDSSMRTWRRAKDQHAYHLGVACGLSKRPREAHAYFSASRPKNPEHEWQRAQDELIRELTELVGMPDAFRGRVTEIVQRQRESLKLEPARAIELPS